MTLPAGQFDVPGKPSHRGPDPRDAEAFDAAWLPALRAAAADYSWLLSREYARCLRLKLVGDRYRLTERQRMAVRRSACSEYARDASNGALAKRSLAGSELVVDGFNVLLTVEVALGGVVVLSCRDGTYRDIAGLHGTYRRVNETMPAISLLGGVISGLGVRQCRWLFDRPVSNSGRIRSLFLKYAEENGLDWLVELVDDPDPVLKASSNIIATADSAVLDACSRWFNLARSVVESRCAGALVVDLFGADP